jgi:hypothetical protein
LIASRYATSSTGSLLKLQHPSLAFQKRRPAGSGVPSGRATKMPFSSESASSPKRLSTLAWSRPKPWRKTSSGARSSWCAGTCMAYGRAAMAGCVTAGAGAGFVADRARWHPEPTSAPATRSVPTTRATPPFRSYRAPAMPHGTRGSRDAACDIPRAQDPRPRRAPVRSSNEGQARLEHPRLDPDPILVRPAASRARRPRTCRPRGRT